jgi:hypothetical protein
MRDFFCKVWLATSHRRKDLVVTKVVRLGGSRCRPTGEDGQKTLLVQKFRCNTVKMSISITLGSHSSRRAGLHPHVAPRDKIIRAIPAASIRIRKVIETVYLRNRDLTS